MLEFAPNWKQSVQFPYNERRLTDILKTAHGALGHAIRSNSDTVHVVACTQMGGAPGAAAQDSQPRVTLTWGHNTYQVRLNQFGGIVEVTS